MERWDAEQESPDRMDGDELLGWRLFQEQEQERDAQAQAHVRVHASAASGEDERTALLRSFSDRLEIPDVTTCLPDVILHAGECAFGLHLSVLATRCPTLCTWVLQVRHQPPALPSSDGTDSSSFSLRLVCMDEEEKESEPPQPLTGNEEMKAPACPMRTVAMLTPMTYVRCIAEGHQRIDSDSSTASASASDSEEDELLMSRVKRIRHEVPLDADNQEIRPPLQRWPRSRRNLFGKEKRSHTRPQRSRNRGRKDNNVAYRRYGALHVELVGADPMAVIPVVEFMYTGKVRLLHDSSAWQTAQLAQWLEMANHLRYTCLRVAIRQVTPATWVDMLLAASTLDDEPLRRVLCSQLTDFVRSLEILQYQEVTDKLETDKLQNLEDHDMLVRAVVSLMKHVPMMALWQKLRIGLEMWLFHRFAAPELPSLYTMSKDFAPQWEPYMELSKVECCAEPNRSKLASVLEFGEFVFQVRVDILASTPLVWRIIKRTSPKFLLEDEDVLENSSTLADDPQFWITGVVKIKYRRFPLDGIVVTEEANILYRHTRKQYGQWYKLVSPSQSRSGGNPIRLAVDEGFEDFRDPAKNYYRTTMATMQGKFFVWGDPVCSLYHRLLQLTLFYCPPTDGRPEFVDDVVVAEMKRFPVDTLVMVLLGDHISIPDGEKTLLRCLNKMVFGPDFPHVDATDAHSPGFNGRAEDVDKLYRCVRWCFVPIEDIITTLRRSPRHLKFYELILEGLQSAPRRFHRRLPFGWRKSRDAYIKNETNVSEFTIEAGDEQLAPEYFTADGVARPRANYAHTNESVFVSSGSVRPRSAE